MNDARLKKILLLFLAGGLLWGASRLQSSLNIDRNRLGLTRTTPLDNAPPALAFTTVALGGFRGLISNALWIRASDLQDEDKFFEMVQLADWITKLEPHYVQVWLMQAWNMAYNISVKFKDYPDRWRWVKQGIELLRDDGLRFNPNETFLYRELAWFFQNKLGANLDDANMFYKQAWANEMAVVFADKPANFEELINPQTPDQRRRAALLINHYKMDPRFMKEVNERYGPLEWRLPEAHAIYWAAKGLEQAKENPSRVKPEDLINLRRVIYQSMQLSFQRGRLIANPFTRSFTFGPNLDIIPRVSEAYEQAAQEDTNFHDHILTAHRNFLRDAVYFLYAHNRVGEAAYWFKYIGQKYPTGHLIDGQTNTLPANMTLEEYAVERLQEDVGEPTSRDRVKAALEELLVNSYMNLAIGEQDRAAGFVLLAQRLHATYDSKTKVRNGALVIESIEEIKADILKRLLDPKDGAPYPVRVALRERLGMEAEPPIPASTNSVPVGAQNP